MRLSNVLFHLDYEQFEESIVNIFSEPSKFDEEKCQTSPYGTLFLDFIELDGKPFEDIAKVSLGIIEYFSVDTARKHKDELDAACLAVRPIVEALPDAVATYRGRGLNLLDSMARQDNWQNVDNLSKMLSAFHYLFIDARSIANSLKRMDRILKRHVLFETIPDFEATHELRLNMVCESLERDFFDHTEITQIPKIFSADGFSKFVLYSETGADMRGMLISYIADMIEKEVYIRICKHCGRYFIAQGKAIFCERTVHEDNATCRQIGARLRYERTLRDSPVKKEYRQAYKNNYGRYSKGKLSEQEFNQWKAEAKAKLNLVLQDKLDAQSFVQWLK